MLLKSPIATQTSAKQQNIVTKLVLQPLHKTTTASNFAAELHHQIRTTYLLTYSSCSPTPQYKTSFFSFPFFLGFLFPPQSLSAATELFWSLSVCSNKNMNLSSNVRPKTWSYTYWASQLQVAIILSSSSVCWLSGTWMGLLSGINKWVSTLITKEGTSMGMTWGNTQEADTMSTIRVTTRDLR